MTGRYLTDLADVLRAAGLDVVEVDGWQTRARGSGGYADGKPWVYIWHHTASDTTPANDVNYICYGSENAPISNLYLARDGVVWVSAAGATNTNGTGGPEYVSRGQIPKDSANTHAIGIEIACNGVGQEYPAVQIDAAFRASIACTDHYGLEPDDVLSHHQWRPSGKIDPATADAVQGPWFPRSINTSGTWSLDDLRAECRRRATYEPPDPAPTPKGDLVFTVLQIIDHPEELGGMADANGIIAQVSWLSPSRSIAVKAAGAPTWTLSTSDVINCDLIGPLPPSFIPANFANVVT